MGWVLGRDAARSDSPFVEVLKDSIPPLSPSITELLRTTPATETEALLLAALKESVDAQQHLRERVAQLQAAQILNEAYCERIRTQLAYKEEKKNKKAPTGKIMGDGLPHMLTSDEFL
ncbi:hypothetical protein FA15DRAFT_607213, partial [Coprinopsis marcescibilis]